MELKLYWPASGMPHGYACETPVHVVYRLADCLPVGVLKELTRELVDQLTALELQHPGDTARIDAVKEEFLLRYDELLDAQDQSKYILHKPEVARIVLDSWRTLHERRVVRLHAACIMGNHAHAVLQGWPGMPDAQLGKIIGEHKSFTTKLILEADLHADKASRKRKIWAPGFFDRYVRPGSWESVMAYVLNNPVKAGLVKEAMDWPHTLVM